MDDKKSCRQTTSAQKPSSSSVKNNQGDWTNACVGLIPPGKLLQRYSAHLWQKATVSEQSQSIWGYRAPGSVCKCNSVSGLESIIINRYPGLSVTKGSTLTSVQWPLVTPPTLHSTSTGIFSNQPEHPRLTFRVRTPPSRSSEQGPICHCPDAVKYWLQLSHTFQCRSSTYRPFCFDHFLWDIELYCEKLFLHRPQNN